MGRKKKQMGRIDLKVAAARAEGLSYGQWVAKHPEGLPPGFVPPEPEEPEEIVTPAREPVPRTRKHGIPVKPLPALMPCVVCGREFKPKAANAKYCGMDCAKKLANEKQAARRGSKCMPEKMPCAICGREFKPNAPNAKYCGDSCVEEAARRRKAARIARARAAQQKEEEKRD